MALVATYAIIGFAPDSVLVLALSSIPRKNIMLPDNGDCVYFTPDAIEYGGQMPHGSLLVDQNGSIVSGLVVKDRLMLSEEGILTVILTLDKNQVR